MSARSPGGCLGTCASRLSWDLFKVKGPGKLYGTPFPCTSSRCKPICAAAFCESRASEYFFCNPKKEPAAVQLNLMPIAVLVRILCVMRLTKSVVSAIVYSTKSLAGQDNPPAEIDTTHPAKAQPNSNQQTRRDSPQAREARSTPGIEAPKISKPPDMPQPWPLPENRRDGA